MLLRSNTVDLLTVVTGVEHSGTGLVASIVRSAVPDAIHWAMPHVTSQGEELWWTPAALLDRPARYIVVTRDPTPRDLSTVARGQSPEAAVARRERAERVLASLEPAYWLPVEAVVLNLACATRNLSRWLDAEVSAEGIEVYDLNARWRGAG